MSLLEINGLSQSYGDKILYQNAAFDLYKGEHMGVVGQNGAGKSTLISILTGEVIPDKGTVKWQPDISTGHLDQYAGAEGEACVLDYLKTSFGDLYEMEKRVLELYDQYSLSGNEQDLRRASEGQFRLESCDFYSIDTRIDKVVQGLGIAAVGTGRILKELSGGQRTRVILAKLLLARKDVLLLDEPTNYLDKEHVEWLVEYLTGFPGAFVVVSHDFEFLDRVSTCICHVEAETIRKYHGKYTDFLKQKEHLREDHIRRFQAQQQMIKRTETFIRKNIAGNNSRNAKGRRKQLERLERIAVPTYVTKPGFHFQEAKASAAEALTVNNLEIGYEYPLLPKLSFRVLRGEKIVITGFNGIGKSTLLKTLMGEISRKSGEFYFADQIKAGYYDQELRWDNREADPIQILAQEYPVMTEKQIRSQLAACGVKKDSVRQPVRTLSGGEQSKVKLCRLLLCPCNFLILDEPTNHLDADTKTELRRALAAFSGSVIMVSHEQDFYRGWTDGTLDIAEIIAP